MPPPAASLKLTRFFEPRAVGGEGDLLSPSARELERERWADAAEEGAATAGGSVHLAVPWREKRSGLRVTFSTPWRTHARTARPATESTSCHG